MNWLNFEPTVEGTLKITGSEKKTQNPPPDISKGFHIVFDRHVHPSLWRLAKLVRYIFLEELLSMFCRPFNLYTCNYFTKIILMQSCTVCALWHRITFSPSTMPLTLHLLHFWVSLEATAHHMIAFDPAAVTSERKWCKIVTVFIVSTFLLPLFRERTMLK